VSQRFTLDRQSFEQFIAAVSLFQPLRQAATKRINEEDSPLLLYLLETLRAIDSGELGLQAALERVAGLALHIAGGDRAVLWLFTSQKMICRAAAGVNFDEGHIRTALRSKLYSGGAFGEDPPPKLDLMRTLEKYSGSLGSSLAIAILPGGNIAGALAVFSNQSTTFTQRNYASLRLLAGLAQYALTKRVAGRKRQDSLDDSLEENPEKSVFFDIHATSSMDLRGSVIASGFLSETSRYAPRVSLDLARCSGSRRPQTMPSPSTRATLSTENGGKPTNSTQDRIQARESLRTPAASPADPDAVTVDHGGVASAPFVAQERIATARLVSPEPAPEHLQHGQIEDVYMPAVGTPVALGVSINEHPQNGTGLQSLSVSAALAARERLQRFQAAALDAVRNYLRCVRDVRVNWIALKQTAPPFAILGVMSLFVGLLTSDRQPLVGSSLSATAEAPTTPVTYNSGNSVDQKAVAMLSLKKSTAVPIETSHLQITDRQTAATIAELNKYEVRNLRRAADYDDDQAALQLGMLYELGRGFPQSCTTAAKWVTKAAENGNAAAEYNLGLRYRDGDGVDTNLQQAENWLRRAVAHKNSNAKRALDALPSYYPEPSIGKGVRTRRYPSRRRNQ